MIKKLLLVLPVVLVVAGVGAYTFALGKAEEQPKAKVEGSVYVLGKDFFINLADGRFAKLTVALLLDPHDTSATPAESGGHGAAPTPPEGFGTMPQEAIVRDIVTTALSGAKVKDLTNRERREAVKKRILDSIKKSTDVHVDAVLLTDLVVQ